MEIRHEISSVEVLKNEVGCIVCDQSFFLLFGQVRKSPETSKVNVKALNAINDDGFAPKPFSSSKSKKMMENIVIDLKKQTIKVPEVEPVEPDSIFHHNVSFKFWKFCFMQ